MNYYNSFTSMTTQEVGSAVLGSLELINEHLKKRTGTLFLGMTAINLGSRFHGVNAATYSMFMQIFLEAGIGEVGARGALTLLEGVKQKNVLEIISGATQTVAGIAGVIFVYNLDTKIILVAHQASIIALPSAFIAKSGIIDLEKGLYKPGMGKLLLGIVGTASVGYYVYNEGINRLSRTHSQTLSADQLDFLEKNKDAIELMYTSKKASKGWSELGNGASKVSFEHPNLPGLLIKIPNSEFGFRSNSGEDDLRLHHANLEQIRYIADHFDRIVLPNSYLYQTSKGIMIVEEKISFQDYFFTSYEFRQTAEEQFNAFKSVANLCDLDLLNQHNAGLISGMTPSKIGIIDFDCIDEPRNLNKFLHPDSGNLKALLYLSIGTIMLVGAAITAKKLAGLNSRKIIELGLVVSAIAGPFTITQSGLKQPAATITFSSFAMAATAAAVITASLAIKTYSWIKNFNSRR